MDKTSEYIKTANDNFRNHYTRRMDGVTMNSQCRSDFPGMTLDEAREAYVAKRVAELAKADEEFWKVAIFERWLRYEKGVEPIQSNVSESRYYYYDGYKFRFSSHVYPTGSMTDLTTLNTIDLCADRQMIDEVLEHFGLLELFNANYPNK